MGRLDVSMRCMEIRSLLDEGELEQAFEMAENLDIERVTSIVDLKVIASVYERMEKYEDAKEVLYRSYEKKPTKMVVYRLAYLCVKTESFDDAEFYYREFIQMAPNSSDKYILRYGIDRAKGVDYYIRIATLQQLKAVDYREEWGYELAKVYHKAGLYEDCIRECDDLILWFGEGVIIEKAKLLRKYHTEGKASLDAYGVFEKDLTPEQVEHNREKFRFDTKDLGRQIKELAEMEDEQRLKGDLERDLEKTVDLRKAMIEDTEALDLLGREVHRSWGSVAPSQGNEVIQIKKLRTKNEQGGFWKRKKNVPDMEEILAEEEQDMENSPEEDWEIRESVAEQPKFQAAKLQKELAEEIARLDTNDTTQNELIDDYANQPIYYFEEYQNMLLNGEQGNQYQPEYEGAGYEEQLGQEEIGYEEEPESEEAVYEDELEPEEVAYEEVSEYREEARQKKTSYKKDPIYKEEPKQKETDHKKNQVHKEELKQEKIDYKEDQTYNKEELNQEKITYKEEMNQEETANVQDEIIEQEIQEEKTNEVQREIPAYIQRDRNSDTQEISIRIGDRTENISEEQKTLRILRRLLGGKGNQEQKEDTKTENATKETKEIKGTKEIKEVKESKKIDAHEEISEFKETKKQSNIGNENENKETAHKTEENGNATQKRDNMAPEGARVNVVKVEPVATKDKKQRRKAKLHSQEKDLKEEKAASGVVKRYMGKKTTTAFEEEETTDVYEQNLQQTMTENPPEVKEYSVKMEDVWKLFPQYKQNVQACEGILSLFRSIFDENGVKNLIVTSKNSDDAMVMCVNMADILCEYGVIENKQPIIISAEELNKMHLEKKYEQVKGKMLQITGARKITPDTAQSIMNMLKELGNNVIVVLNDGKPYMDDFMNEYKIMQKYFPHFIIL